MSIFSVNEIKRSKADQREAERERKKMEKRAYRDLRWAVERVPLGENDWRELLTLHAQHGKEGGREMAHRLLPQWSLIQENLHGGTVCPDDLWDQWKPETVARSSNRKIRSDAGRARK